MKRNTFQSGSTVLLALGLLLSGCVNVDPKTNEIIPRGSQSFEFAEVKRGYKDLRVGLTRYQVVSLIGTAAERSRRDDVWIYLPERPAVLIPGKALRLEFDARHLVKFGYHAIILGHAF